MRYNYIMGILAHILIIAGLGAMGALWAFAFAGMLATVWDSALEPLMNIVREKLK